MSHLDLPSGIEQALLERLKGGQTPASIGSEIGFIRSAEQLQREMAEGRVISPATGPRGPEPVPLLEAQTPKPLGRPFTKVEQTMGIRSSVNAFTIGIPPISLPGGITVGGFQLPVPIPRFPLPVPRVPGRLPTPRPGGGGRFPFPIPIPIPLGGGGSDACPRGFHPDKKTGTKCVRNRRMNPLNPRALKRSLRRIDRFEDFVNRTASLTGLRLAKRSTRRKKSCR